MKRVGSRSSAGPLRASPQLGHRDQLRAPSGPDLDTGPHRTVQPPPHVRPHQVVQPVLRLVVVAHDRVDQARLDQHVERGVPGPPVAEHRPGHPAAERVDRQVRHRLDHPSGPGRQPVDHPVEPGAQHPHVGGHVTGEPQLVEPVGHLLERQVRPLQRAATDDPHRERHPRRQPGHLARAVRLRRDPLRPDDPGEQRHRVVRAQRAQRHRVGRPQPGEWGA